MNPASYRRERWWSTNYASSRELFWFSGVVLRLVYSCLSSCCSRAQQNGQRNQNDFGLLYPPSHARAAAPPSGRSFFCGPRSPSIELSAGKTDVGKCKGRPGAELWDCAARGGNHGIKGTVHRHHWPN